MANKKDQFIESEKIFIVFIGFLFFIITLPVFLVLLGIRILGSFFNSIKERKKTNIITKLTLILIIALGTGISFILTKGWESKIINWYDYLLPIASEIKIIIKLVGNKTIHLFPLITSLLLSIITSSILFTPIFWAFRNTARNNYINELIYYQKKLKNEEVVKDPSKNISFFSHFVFFILCLNRKDVQNKKLEHKDLKRMLETHIMLDQVYGIPRKSLSQHIAIMGTTGSGKTQTTFKFIRDGIRQNKPTFLIDGKGDVSNIFKMKALASKYNKPFYLFTLDGKKLFYKQQNTLPNKYNPFNTSKEGILVDSLMALFDYSEEHYKASARTYMDILIATMLATKTTVSWDNIMYYLDKWKLIELLKKRYKVGNKGEANLKKRKPIEGKISLSFSDKEGDNELESFNKSKNKYFKIDMQQLNNIDDRAITGFSARIGMFYNTTRETITQDGFTLEDVFKKEGVCVFSLNSLEYQEQASAIGRLIINNVKASAETNASLDIKSFFALDEFNVFADNNIIDILNKTRSKGYEILLGFQSVDDLTNISESFKNQVIENTNIKIIHKTNDPTGAEYLSKVLGTKKEQKKTYVAEDDDTTGRESIRVVESFIAHPNALKELKTGECFAKYVLESGATFVTPEKIKIHLDRELLGLGEGVTKK